jgi:hypothetical protein
MGGTPVYESQGMRAITLNAITTAEQYGGIYAQAALISYNQSEYSAALYGAAYAEAFDSQMPNYSTNSIAEITAMADNSTNGIWPTEFAEDALFYRHVAGSATNTTAYADINYAYSLSLLASKLSSINTYISHNLLPAPASGTAVSALNSSLSGVQHTVSEIWELLVLFAIAVVILLILVLYLIVKLSRLEKYESAVRMRNAPAYPIMSRNKKRKDGRPHKSVYS